MRVLSPPGAVSSLQTLRPGIDGSTRAHQAHSVQTEYAKANLQSEEVVELRRTNSTIYLVLCLIQCTRLLIEPTVGSGLPTKDETVKTTLKI